MLDLDKFQTEIRKLEITESNKCLLAVSGGVDSMVLWHLLHSLKINYELAHVNFSLRDRESDDDMGFVKKQAKERGVTVHVKVVDTSSYAKEHHLSIQMAAREIRYQWFAELKKECNYQYLITAHHLDDSIETFFINLNRGTGIKGLTGISSRKDLIRPLLTFSKDEIIRYAKKNKIAFREDSSNSELKYERNWFRHQVLKPWKERNPDFLSNMQLTMKHLAGVQFQLEEYLDTKSLDLKKELVNGYISIERIVQLKDAKRILYYLMEPYGFSLSQMEQLLESITNKQVGKKFLSANYVLWLDREKVFFQKYNEARENGIKTINEDISSIASPISLKFELQSTPVHMSSNRNIEFIDHDKLNYPLELRLWQPGDRMIPLGMKGKKKVSDILVDQKIPLKDKRSYYVLCSGDKIIWLVGLKLDDRFKISDESKKILKIEWIMNE